MFKNKRGAMLAICQDCGERHFIRRRELDRAAPPRCAGCGGRLRLGTAYEKLVDGMDAAKEDRAKRDAKRGTS